MEEVKQKITNWLEKNYSDYMNDTDFEDTFEAKEYLIEDAMASVGKIDEEDWVSIYKFTKNKLDEIHLKE